MRNKNIIHKCKNCGKKFFHRSKGANKYCSHKCYVEHYWTKERREAQAIKSRKRILSKNPMENKENRKKVSLSKLGKKRKPFSKKCKENMSNAHKGEKSWFWGKKGSQHPGWRGGLSSLNQLIRSNGLMDSWRRKIFERDNFTCQECKGNGRLVAHHIVTFITLLRKNHITTVKEAEKCDELWNLDNGITLCKKCHDPTIKREKLYEERYKEIIESFNV